MRGSRAEAGGQEWLEAQGAGPLQVAAEGAEVVKSRTHVGTRAGRTSCGTLEEEGDGEAKEI